MDRSRRGKGSNSQSLRLLRIGENVRHAISLVITRGDIQDTELAGVSVTVSEVRVSSDFRNAAIFVMPLGGINSDVVIEALNRNAAYIRGEMNKKVHMKFSPQLNFKLDESFDEASHIEALLRDPRVAQDLAASDEPEAGAESVAEDQDD
ncbi:MAG: ribosome-binding factor A [Kordiimonadales bacterium]|nr:MAG: ribosome-binding factor A [Kordiimonadales bacterium]